jgi:nicotinate-nucleotide pyrophosphorylase (carboxylating)
LHAGDVNLSPKDWQAVVREAAARAVGEDVGPSDVTSRTVIPEGAFAVAVVVAKEPCVLAGLEVAEAVFREVDGALKWSAKAKDGDRIVKGDVVAEVEGAARSILTAERCALNFLQQLSGVATQTAVFVNAIKGTSARILDTRKTTPGLRALERHAVRCGGGVNHRTGLYDGILIKENHLIFISPTELGGVIKKARAAYPDLPLVVEADSVALAEKLLSQPVDRILLDNLSPEEVTEVVALRAKKGAKVDLEASGGVTEVRALALAKAGVEWISIGGITHSARAMDFSLDIQPK